jgi:hypothetical protein
VPPAPLIVAVLLGLSALLGSVGLSLNGGPITSQAALLLVAGGGLLTVIAVSGVLLARGRWSRRLAIVVAGGWFTLALAGQIQVIDAATLTVSTGVAVIAVGPWLNRWLRRLPSATAPPPAAALLLILLVATPAIGGAAYWNTTSLTAMWALSAWSLLVAFGLARALSPALWAVRTLHVPVAATVAVVLGTPVGIVLVAAAAIESSLAWRKDVHLAVSPIIPERAPAVPIPPELVNPAIMEAAGLDDRGLPLENT